MTSNVFFPFARAILSYSLFHKALTSTYELLQHSNDYLSLYFQKDTIDSRMLATDVPDAEVVQISISHFSSLLLIEVQITNKIITMNSSPRRIQASLFSTKQCKEMMQKDFKAIVNQHIINQQQEQLVEKFSKALKKDEEKEEYIKEKLIQKFFSLQKGKKRRNILNCRLNNSENFENDMRIKLQKQMRQQLSVVLNRKSQTPRGLNHESDRYCNSPMDFSFCRPFDPPLSYNPRSYTSQRQRQRFSSRIDTIIEESNRLKTRKNFSSRKYLRTASDRKRQAKIEDKNQKLTIINKIIQNDIDDFLKSYSFDGELINPESQRKLYEDRKRKELTNLDKYSLNFMNYIREKTPSNIEKLIYNQKIRQKNSYIEKFQKYILEEFKFSNEAKRKLEKIFQGIELQFKGPSKSRQIRNKFKPK